MSAQVWLALLGVAISMVGACVAGYGIGSVFSGWLFRIFWIVVGTLTATGGVMILASNS